MKKDITEDKYLSCDVAEIIKNHSLINIYKLLCWILIDDENGISKYENDEKLINAIEKSAEFLTKAAKEESIEYNSYEDLLRMLLNLNDDYKKDLYKKQLTNAAVYAMFAYGTPCQKSAWGFAIMASSIAANRASMEFFNADRFIRKKAFESHLANQKEKLIELLTENK